MLESQLATLAFKLKLTAQYPVPLNDVSPLREQELTHTDNGLIEAGGRETFRSKLIELYSEYSVTFRKFLSNHSKATSCELTAPVLRVAGF